MELVKVDALQFEAAQAHFDTLDQIAGATDVLGFRRALARDAALGGDDDAGRVGSESFADEALGDFGAVGIGRVEECDAELDSAAQNAAALGFVGGLAPRAITDQAHGSVTETVDRKIAADEESAGERRVDIRCSHNCWLSDESRESHPGDKNKDVARLGYPRWSIMSCLMLTSVFAEDNTMFEMCGSGDPHDSRTGVRRYYLGPDRMRQWGTEACGCAYSD